MMEKKTDDCHAHFTRVRKAMIMDSTIKICYAVMKYVKKKRAIRAAEVERQRIAKEALAKKKKSKYAPRASVKQSNKVAAVSSVPTKATPSANKSVRGTNDGTPTANSTMQ